MYPVRPQVSLVPSPVPNGANRSCPEKAIRVGEGYRRISPAYHDLEFMDPPELGVFAMYLVTLKRFLLHHLARSSWVSPHIVAKNHLLLVILKLLLADSIISHPLDFVFTIFLLN